MLHTYNTSELEVASFLKARGYKLLGAKLSGRLVEFFFEPSAEQAIDTYFAGIELPALELFEAHRCLRAIIQQIEEHQTHRNGSDTTWTKSQQV